MVYCGKPSQGCQMCRMRRIKCDETKPTCNQCAKSRRQCPGYIDQFDLVFRNETQVTEWRYQKASRRTKAGKRGRGASRAFSERSDDAPGSSSTAAASVITPALNVPPEELASCHFLSNFVLVPRQGGTRGYMDYLIPLLKSNSADRKVLIHAFNACALASMGNRVASNGVNFADRALSEYTKALASTHLALKDPELSKADGTLAAVLLLGLFENITAKEMGMFAWGSHIEGAIEMVKARGRKQLRSKTGLLLFIAVRTQMIIHTLTSAKAPIMGVDWWISDAVKDETGAACQRLCIRTAELRADVTRLMTTMARSPENMAAMQDLIRRARAVDDDCVAWMDTVPPQWRFKTVAWEDNVPDGDYGKAEVFPGRVDMYPDFWIASVWNMVRTARLVVASILVRCAAWACAPVDYRTTAEYAAASRSCAATITDIIASVPYQLGWHLRRRDVMQRHELSGFACGEEDCMKGLAGYFLTWPLANLNSQDYTTDAQRAWAVGRMRFIANDLGVRYAGILAQLQIRIPSMLIRRDGLMAQPYPMAYDFMKLLSAQRPGAGAAATPPADGQPLNPLQHREAMQKAYLDERRAELLAKASGESGPSGEWVAQKMLHV